LESKPVQLAGEAGGWGLVQQQMELDMVVHLQLIPLIPSIYPDTPRAIAFHSGPFEVSLTKIKNSSESIKI
jgi:hypothetical protein